MEGWIVEEVNNGAVLPGLYPMNAETKARYAAFKKEGRASPKVAGESNHHGHLLAGSRPTRRAPKDYFTGTVWQDPIVAAQAPARLAATRVTFEPGARTAWHTHPLGQTLYVIYGVGRVQALGGPIREIRAGTWSGFRRAKSTGTARRRPTP